jgi:DNA-binding CsgD family transcriptional regulator
MYGLIIHVLMTLMLVSTVPLVSISVFSHGRHKRKSLRYFIVFACSTFLYIFRIWMETIYPVFVPGTSGSLLEIFSMTVASCGAFGILVFAFLFVHRILEIHLDRRVIVGFSAVTGIGVILPNLLVMPGRDLIVPLLMVSVFIYLLARMLVSWKNIGDPVLKTAVKGTFLLSLIYIPCSILLNARVSPPIDRIALVAILTNTIIQLILASVFWGRYFGRDPYLREQRLSDVFVAKFGITERERDIIECILRGLDNKGISVELSISPKTVANLLSNAFRKANVNSRIQLVSLIHGTEL